MKVKYTQLTMPIIITIVIIMIAVYLLKNTILYNTEILYYDLVDIDKNEAISFSNDIYKQVLHTARLYTKQKNVGNVSSSTIINVIGNKSNAFTTMTLFTMDGILMFNLAHETIKDVNHFKPGHTSYNIVPIFVSGKYENKTIRMHIEVQNNEKQTRKVTITHGL